MKQPKPLWLLQFLRHCLCRTQTKELTVSAAPVSLSSHQTKWLREREIKAGDSSKGSYTTSCGSHKKIVCPTHPLVCVLHYAIHRPEEGLDIQSDWIFVSITMDSPQEWNFHSPTNLCSPTPPSPAPEGISPHIHDAFNMPTYKIIAACIEVGIHDVLVYYYYSGLVHSTVDASRW